ncbi:MAG: TlpA disulfide reductase family protein [Bacteroidota bacterium]
MRYIFAIYVCMLIFSCQSNEIVSYEDALKQCDEIVAEQLESGTDVVGYNTSCLIGAEIPDFEATTLDDENISKEQLKGKLSIINFWFINCAPCLAEIPGFNAIVEKFGSDQVNYIAIGRDDQADTADFLKKHPWTFQQITDGAQLIDQTFKIRSGYPTTFLLDENAKIILAFRGGKIDTTASQAIQDKLVPRIEDELN